MTNQDRLKKALDRLQHERAVFLSKIDGLNQIQLDYQPSRHSWSIGQVAHHVGLGEGVWQGYLKSILKDGDQEKGTTRKVSLDEVPFSSRVVPDFILNSPLVLTPLSVMMNVIPRPLQSMFFAVPLVKMDAGPRMQPMQGLPRAQILKFLEEIRKNTLQLVEPLADWDLTRFRILHPLVGDQDVYGILELLASHEQRHAQQIGTLKKANGFPPGDARTQAL
jgi:hypothetical protein